MPATPSLSIILPALDESRLVVEALRRLNNQLHAQIQSRLHEQGPSAEVILVDGGSRDGTPDLAKPHCRVVAGERGRARQMNQGAALASGAWLLFCHVDTRLPGGFWEEIARAAGAGFQAGAFRLRIRGRHWLLPLLALGANLRTRWTGIALGDQALFCSRELFDAQGGFPTLPILEDYVFTLRLRKAGIPLYLARSAAETSGRRWDEQGFWRTWWQFRSIYRRIRREQDPARLREGLEDVR